MFWFTSSRTSLESSAGSSRSSVDTYFCWSRAEGSLAASLRLLRPAAGKNCLAASPNRGSVERNETVRHGMANEMSLGWGSLFDEGFSLRGSTGCTRSSQLSATSFWILRLPLILLPLNGRQGPYKQGATWSRLNKKQRYCEIMNLEYHTTPFC